ncbi:hypothetical protein M422DRAFT_266573 [Sphaerobolus stellatus SS14]|uniref:Unplaced genomic scaffold SPHSTscaffold_163, whole genome shotgun sequence n=1 Tax=Sphaerobolus stellatus (strain SS14) TaxID=990650 RepID=A0A0C9TNR0_SPHS4|nr:hypothetical protein M422DRAFT_266573 [Sphaerobolus stellatus SS14]
MSTDKAFACPNCTKTFRHKGHLARHRQSHLSEKTFICSKCGKKKFNRKDHYIRHENSCRTEGVITKLSEPLQPEPGEQIPVPQTVSPDIQFFWTDFLSRSIHEGTSTGPSSELLITANSHTDYQIPNNSSSINSFHPNEDVTSQTYFSSWLPLEINWPPQMPTQDIAPFEQLSLETKGYLSLYFQYYSANSPFFHAPTWDRATCHPLLLRALSLSAANYVRGPGPALEEAQKYALRELQGDLRHKTMITYTELPQDDHVLHYQLLTAMSIAQATGLFHPNVVERQVSTGYHPLLITMIRRSPLLELMRSYQPPDSAAQLNEESWRRWVLYESIKR